MTQQPSKPTKMLVVNATAITLLDEQFIDGYKAGYATFHEVYASTPQSDLSIYQFLLTIIDINYEGRRQAGYVTGWMAALFEVSPGAYASPQVIDTPDEPQEPRSIIEFMRSAARTLLY